MSSAAAGLVLATGIKMALPLRRNPRALVFVALTIVAVAVLKIPLVWIVITLLPLELRRRRGVAAVTGRSVLAELGLQFAVISVVAIGGGNAVLPEMHRVVVDVHGWMSSETFANSTPSRRRRPGRTSWS